MNGSRAVLKRRWPTIALVASLLLNGFLLGLLATGSLRHHRGSDLPRIGGYELRRLAERLPDEGVEQVAAELRRVQPELEPRIERLRAMRDEIARMAAEPQPDRARIDERLRALRAEAQGMQEAVQKATYDALLQLPPEMRTALAEEPEKR